MAFSKFDPHRPEPATAPSVGERRAALLKWLPWIAWIYTAIGFGFMAYWLFG